MQHLERIWPYQNQNLCMPGCSAVCRNHPQMKLIRFGLLQPTVEQLFCLVSNQGCVSQEGLFAKWKARWVFPNPLWGMHTDRFVGVVWEPTTAS